MFHAPPLEKHILYPSILTGGSKSACAAMKINIRLYALRLVALGVALLITFLIIVLLMKLVISAPIPPD